MSSNYKCLITGGAGFIGSTIADLLLEIGHDVVIIDNLVTGKIENINHKAKYYECDLNSTKQSLINTYFKDVDYVFHCSALPNVQYSIEYPKESNDSNVNSTIKTLIACKENQIKKIIYSGSCSVYGNAKIIPTGESEIISPLSPYALQKYIGEQYCELYYRMYNLQYVILRYFNVYGERMSDEGAYVSVLSRFLRSFKNNDILNITNDGNQKRDFVYVKDVAKANILAMYSNINADIFNIGYGLNYSVNTLASLFNRPMKYGETRIEPFETMSDITKAQKILNWYPETNVQTWIKQTINNHLDDIK